MSPLSLFSGPYAMLARLAFVGIILAAAFATGWVKGDGHGTQKLIEYQAKQAAESVKVITKQGETTERVVTRYLDRVKLVEGATVTIEKEVTKYVESKPLAMACLLDNRWLQLHNAAASGSVPPPTGPTDDTTGTTTAAGALPTITKNYGAAIRNADKLEALQGWVREQFKTMNGKALEY